jgi:hypothetical protein
VDEVRRKTPRLLLAAQSGCHHQHMNEESGSHVAHDADELADVDEPQTLTGALMSLVFFRDGLRREARVFAWQEEQRLLERGTYTITVHTSPLSVDEQQRAPDTRHWRQQYYDNEIEDYDLWDPFNFFEDDELPATPYDFTLDSNEPGRHPTVAYGMSDEIHPETLFYSRLANGPYVYGPTHIAEARKREGFIEEFKFEQMSQPEGLPRSFVATINAWFDKATVEEEEALYIALSSTPVPAPNRG